MRSADAQNGRVQPDERKRSRPARRVNTWCMGTSFLTKRAARQDAGDQHRPPQQIALKPLAEAQIVASSAPRYGAHNWDCIAMAW